jgi:hypothetical protein
MANSPAARTKRKSTKQNYHEDLDSSYESSSSCSEDQPLSPCKKRSDHKKTINSALARTPAGRKVSDDEVHNDTSLKKKNDVASTLKNDVLTNPVKYRLGVAHFSMLKALKILIFSYSLFCVLILIPP